MMRKSEINIAECPIIHEKMIRFDIDEEKFFHQYKVYMNILDFPGRSQDKTPQKIFETIRRSETSHKLLLLFKVALLYVTDKNFHKRIKFTFNQIKIILYTYNKEIENQLLQSYSDAFKMISEYEVEVIADEILPEIIVPKDIRKEEVKQQDKCIEDLVSKVNTTDLGAVKLKESSVECIVHVFPGIKFRHGNVIMPDQIGDLVTTANPNESQKTFISHLYEQIEIKERNER